MVTRRPAPVPGQPPRPVPGMTAGAAFEASFESLAGQLDDGIRAFLVSGGAEPVHRLRVAERRIRALLDCYRALPDPAGAKRLKRELKWLHARFGPVRDLDVFRAECVAPLLAEARGSDADAVAALAGAVDAARAAAARKAAAAVETRRYAALSRRLALWSHGAWREGVDEASARARIEQLAAASLARADKRVRKAMKRAEGGRRADQHQVRIEVKKLRYAVQFLMSAFPGRRADAYLKRLTRLQDAFGVIQDSESAAALARRLARGRGKTLARAAKLVAAREEKRGDKAMKRTGRLTKSFAAARKFWTPS